MDNRSKKIVLVSHCILNQNSVVQPLARAKGAYRSIVEAIMESNTGIVQLPCPEIIHLGMERPPMSKEDYDTSEYRQLCQDLLSPIMTQLLLYIDAGYHIHGVIGIDQSPTCSLDTRGILMETLFILLEQHNIKLRQIAVPTAYHEDSDTTFVKILSEWLYSTR